TKRSAEHIKTLNQSTKRKTYDTLPVHIRDGITLCICGHYLLAHDVGDYRRARRFGGYWQDTSTPRTIHPHRRRSARCQFLSVRWGLEGLHPPTIRRCLLLR